MKNEVNQQNTSLVSFFTDFFVNANYLYIRRYVG
jgi:hypothetical protein